MTTIARVCACCGSSEYARKLVTLRSGKQIVICKDTVECLNRSHGEGSPATERPFSVVDPKTRNVLGEGMTREEADQFVVDAGVGSLVVVQEPTFFHPDSNPAKRPS